MSNKQKKQLTPVQQEYQTPENQIKTILIQWGGL
ncbi:hypothetical protein J2S25_000138 [Mesobacillus stamsii]|uniref:Uncharacterized protein n=1 Tax=Mesobacillus stamsii TaxID=225347 RepID=A0ABU0FQ60_9BACI|nr:hypothetical protein [Mesobacillus stamsii]